MAYKIMENSAQSVISIAFYGVVDDEGMLQMMSELYVLEEFPTSN